MMQARQGQGRPMRFVEAVAVLVVLVLVALIGPAEAQALDRAMDRVFTLHGADAEDRFLGSAFL